MIFKVLLLLFVFRASREQSDEEWAYFKSKFNRSYESHEDQVERYGIWLGNMEYIAFQNTLGHSYRLGMNNLTDRTQQEVLGILGGRISSQPTSQTPKVSFSDVQPPAALDWRALGKVTPVKSQGNCGSCWSFAAVAGAQSLIAIKYNILTDLSEQYVLECSGSSSCYGGWIDESMQLIIRTGTPNESDYPYRGYGSTAGICNSIRHVMMPADCTRYSLFNVSDATLKQMLVSSPVAALILAQTNFRSYTSGVYTCQNSDTQPNELNHAVLIVGYDNEDHYIIKNSWGTSWGQNGFGRVNQKFNCGARLFVYQYESSMAPMDNSSTTNNNSNYSNTNTTTNTTNNTSTNNSTYNSTNQTTNNRTTNQNSSNTQVHTQSSWRCLVMMGLVLLVAFVL